MSRYPHDIKTQRLALLHEANQVWTTEHRLTIKIVRELYRLFPLLSVDGAVAHVYGYQDPRSQDTGLKRYTKPRTHLREFEGFRPLYRLAEKK